jgi:formate dehydrogenase subunit delta
MNTVKLVRMANSIGEFFAAQPDPNIALDGLAGHLIKFWEPRMRRQLLGYLDEHGGEGLSEFVRSALTTRRSAFQDPQPAADETER